MNKQEAEKLLNKSRKKIDTIDKQILNLIIERTSLAHDIISSKKTLKMDLFDAQREQNIKENLKKTISQTDIETDLIIQIFDLLATINKNEQKKYLD